MKGYKAFEKGMICKGKQYRENTVFEEDEAIVCQKGMHFCKNPLDVLGYYPLIDYKGNFSEFAEVEALDECETDDDKKFCTKKLKIKGKISFMDLFKIEFDALKEKLDSSNFSGYGARIGSSGDGARINSSGRNCVIMCAGNGSIAKAKIGSWITLAEWKYDENLQECVPINVVTKKVDGVEIKEDVSYELRYGKFCEVKNGNQREDC